LFFHFIFYDTHSDIAKDKKLTEIKKKKKKKNGEGVFKGANKNSINRNTTILQTRT